jgi:hypothetical protein
MAFPAQAPLLRAFADVTTDPLRRRRPHVAGRCNAAAVGQRPAAAGTPAGTRIVRVEDGFLRSVGSAPTWCGPCPGCSTTRASTTTHAPSALENLLQDGDVDAAELGTRRQPCASASSPMG